MIDTYIKHWGKLLLRPSYRNEQRLRQPWNASIRDIRAMPPRTQGITSILGYPIEFSDAHVFLFMLDEIFERQIYRFRAHTETPFIIDGGANIGLSALYFKRLYPQSRIIAFEPDAEIFAILQKNLRSANITDVELNNKALWSAQTELKFWAQGIDSGRIVNVESMGQTRRVDAARLRDYLDKTVDFLKLDIEGAEYEVIQDCQELLPQVKNIFVEYHSFAGQKQSLPIILNILEEAGFRVHIHVPYSSPQPLYERRENLGMDLQLNVFGFRV